MLALATPESKAGMASIWAREFMLPGLGAIRATGGISDTVCPQRHENLRN